MVPRAAKVILWAANMVPRAANTRHCAANIDLWAANTILERYPTADRVSWARLSAATACSCANCIR